MGKMDFSDLEDQIKDALKNTFKAIDFAKLKENINDKTESTLNEVKENLKNKSQYLNEKVKNKALNQYTNFMNVTPIDKDKLHMYIAKRPVGSISGIVYMVLGFTFGGILASTIIGYSIFTSLFTSFSTPNFITLGLLFAFFLASIVFGFKGISLRKRVRRFRQYVKTLNGHSYCSIEELAFSTKKKNKFVIKDLNKMIDLGMFPEAHIDDKKTYFMLNDEVYENYLNSQEAFKHRAEEELKKQEKVNEELINPEKQQLRQIIELGNSYIEQIKIATIAIHREDMSTKLNRLQNIVQQIFNYLENNPNKLTEVNKLTNHYLPMTLKLVNSYKELNDQPVQGDNIKNAKKEIEKTIDIINIAFEKLLDDLFGEVALDISTDISVLETLFTQEGLTKNDFKK